MNFVEVHMDRGKKLEEIAVAGNVLINSYTKELVLEVSGGEIITAKRIFKNVLKTVYNEGNYSIVDGCFINSDPQIADPNEVYEINGIKKRVCEWVMEAGL